MKKTLSLFGLALLAVSLTAAGCSEEDTKDASDAVGEAAHDTAEAVGEGTREAGDAIGDAMESGGEKLQEMSDDDDVDPSDN